MLLHLLAAASRAMGRFDLSVGRRWKERMDTLFHARSHVARMRKAFSGLNVVSRWVSGSAFVSKNIKEQISLGCSDQ